MVTFFFNFLPIFLIFTLTTAFDNNSTIASPSPPETITRSNITPFKPGIAIIVGILTTIFSITFLLLLYIKHCRRDTYTNNVNRPSRESSGIDRKVVDLLPLFRFSSLRGSKEGLECAVCLNKFETEEILRLLPKCKHAFHVECVDTWLDAHSTCPLCRYRVDPEDVLLLDNCHDGGRSLFNNGTHDTPRRSESPAAKTSRLSGRHSSAMEIIVETPRENFRGRISLDSWKSRRKHKKEAEHAIRRSVSEVGKSLPGKSLPETRKDGQLLDKHRLEHRIIIDTAEERQPERWSDAQANEMLHLRSELILMGGRSVINGRSVSELTGVSRYESNGREEKEKRGEGVAKRWLDWTQQYKQKKADVQPDDAKDSDSIGV